MTTVIAVVIAEVKESAISVTWRCIPLHTHTKTHKNVIVIICTNAYTITDLDLQVILNTCYTNDRYMPNELFNPPGLQ